MSAQLGRIDWITLFVEDLELARAFYGGVFGLSPIFEDADSVAFRLENTNLNLLRSTAAQELVEPATPGAAGSGPRLQFTVSVADVDATCSELARHGVALLNGPIDRPWGVRTASFTDPAGHLWEIAHDLPQPARE